MDEVFVSFGYRAKVTMQILISAFACLPLRGSEPGVGWEWPKALSDISNHDITVLTQAANRPAIEAYLAEHPQLRLRFRYVALTNHFQRLGSPGHYLFYYIWQLRVLLIFLSTGEWRKYGLIHHLTYGGIRTGSLLWLFPRPFAFGPVGGAETAPFRLYRALGAKFIVKEMVRKISNLVACVDPVLLMMQLRARRVLARTDETKRVLWLSQNRLQVINDVGTSGSLCAPTRPLRETGRPLRLLFAGRLLYWKGLPYLIAALQRLDGDGVALQVDIAGDGPLRETLATAARKLRHIDLYLHGRLPQPDLFRLSQAADAFIFPSLHDSGGTAVIEALSFGLPVICFNLGGPPILVSDGGIALDVSQMDMAAAVNQLAQAIRTLRDSPERCQELSQKAVERAKSLSWRNTVRAAFGGLVSLSAEDDA